MIPSSRQSADTDVSRCAIAAWASRTWAFDSANVLPPLAAARPRGGEPGQGAFAGQLPLELGQRREDAEYEAAGGGGPSLPGTGSLPVSWVNRRGTITFACGLCERLPR